VSSERWCRGATETEQSRSLIALPTRFDAALTGQRGRCSARWWMRRWSCARRILHYLWPAAIPALPGSSRLRLTPDRIVDQQPGLVAPAWPPRRPPLRGPGAPGAAAPVSPLEGSDGRRKPAVAWPSFSRWVIAFEGSGWKGWLQEPRWEYPDPPRAQRFAEPSPTAPASDPFDDWDEPLLEPER